MIPQVSFIISVFDQLDYTKRCLSCLEKTLKDKLTYEVLIVDDGSNEETIHYLHSLEFPHHVTFNSERKGFAKNNNLAASYAKGEYLCLLNNDVFVEGDWLLPMINVFEEKENVGVVGNVQDWHFQIDLITWVSFLDHSETPDTMDNGLKIENLGEKLKNGVQLRQLVA
jgi:GT2 family glycosyltransferase